MKLPKIHKHCRFHKWRYFDEAFFICINCYEHMHQDVTKPYYFQNSFCHDFENCKLKVGKINEV